jgi:hypothetical protein
MCGSPARCGAENRVRDYTSNGSSTAALIVVALAQPQQDTTPLAARILRCGDCAVDPAMLDTATGMAMSCAGREPAGSVVTVVEPSCAPLPQPKTDQIGPLLRGSVLQQPQGVPGGRPGG